MGEELQLSGLSSNFFVCIKNEDGSLGEPVKMKVADPPVWDGEAEKKWKKSGSSISFDMDLKDKNQAKEFERYELYLQRLNTTLARQKKLSQMRSRQRKTLARRYIRELEALKKDYLADMGGKHPLFNPYIFGRTNIPETIDRVVPILHVFVKGKGTIRTAQLTGNFLMPVDVHVRFKNGKIVRDTQEAPRRQRLLSRLLGVGR